MKKTAFTLVALLSVTSINASAQQVEATPSQETPTPVADMIWAKFPDNEDMVQFYPSRALNLNVGGKAVVRCGWLADGSMSGCEVLMENPAGYGFGEATVKLLEAKARVKTRDPKEKIVPGETLTVTLNWNQ